MATQNNVRIINIKSLAQGLNQYVGILSVGFQVNNGNLTPAKNEGEFFPTKHIRRGIPGYPVTINVRAESKTALLELAGEAEGTLVVVGEVDDGSGTIITATANQVQFNNSQGDIQRDADGSFSLTGYAISADGTTLPLTLV